jgi:hypothetical protein
MSTHRFAIGQIVRLKSRMGLAPRTAEFYRIIATLPPHENTPQYRIRNDDERHERVMMEDALEEFGKPAIQDATLAN